MMYRLLYTIIYVCTHMFTSTCVKDLFAMIVYFRLQTVIEAFPPVVIRLCIITIS